MWITDEKDMFLPAKVLKSFKPNEEGKVKLEDGRVSVRAVLIVATDVDGILNVIVAEGCATAGAGACGGVASTDVTCAGAPAVTIAIGLEARLAPEPGTLQYWM